MMQGVRPPPTNVLAGLRSSFWASSVSGRYESFTAPHWTPCPLRCSDPRRGHRPTQHIEAATTGTGVRETVVKVERARDGRVFLVGADRGQTELVPSLASLHLAGNQVRLRT